MRAHTNLRSAFRFTMMMAAATGVTFAASQANADTAGANGGPNSSTGTAALSFDMAQGLDTSIDTGFLGPSVAQVRAVVKIDPVKDGGPLYSIKMPKGAVVEASWAGDKKIVLKAANGSSSDGTIVVRHTLTPSLELKVSAFGLTAQFGFDADKLINKIPGAKFAYDSKATQAFAPWGFTKVDTKLSAPDLTNSVLFSETFANLTEIVTGDTLDPNKWDGNIGVRAATKPTFSYKTTKVMLTGADAPITTLAGESVIDATDGDFMEVMAQVEGQMDVAGTMDIQPFVSMSKVFGYSFSTTIGINAFSKAYTVPSQKVSYQASVVHIPLPNVHVPGDGVDLGAVKAGGSATKTVTIENSGEMAAVMTFKSDNPFVSVPGGSITVAPKSKYDLQLKAAPQTGGAFIAEITVASNDPDSPSQTFKIGANGADVGGTTGSKDDGLPATAASADSGCGCKTAGTTTSTGGWAGIGLLALGITVAARRRRNGSPA
jgi:MYXO-CTERM domain-containing protein